MIPLRSLRTTLRALAAAVLGLLLVSCVALPPGEPTVPPPQPPPIPQTCAEVRQLTSRGLGEGNAKLPKSEVGRELNATRAVRVIDGDTIEIAGGEKVRYIGIDTPEVSGKAEPYGKEASAANKALVEGKPLWLQKDVSERDRYRRLLRYVYTERLMVNAELVREGFARVATFPPDVRYTDCFLELEREAREVRRGLWEIAP